MIIIKIIRIFVFIDKNFMIYSNQTKIVCCITLSVFTKATFFKNLKNSKNFIVI